MTQFEARLMDETDPCFGELIKISPKALVFSSEDAAKVEWVAVLEEDALPTSLSNST
jgi:hypothetical protein